MDMPFSLILDLFVAVLLVVTIGYAVVLNRKLSAIRRDRAELETVAANFAQATLRAEESIRKLKASADGLQGQVNKAESLREDLSFLVSRGGQAADRLEDTIRDARTIEPQTARPRAAQPAEPAGMQHGMHHGAPSSASGRSAQPAGRMATASQHGGLANPKNPVEPAPLRPEGARQDSG
ncbi:MAG: DUF6468 domain-containing protein, partial [Rhodospirillales bacterium]